MIIRHFFKVTSTFGIKKYSVKVDGKWKSVCKAKRRDSMPNSFGSNCETPLDFKAGDNSFSCIYINHCSGEKPDLKLHKFEIDFDLGRYSQMRERDKKAIPMMNILYMKVVLILMNI